MPIYLPFRVQPLLSAIFLSPSSKAYTVVGHGDTLTRIIVLHASEWEEGETYRHSFDVEFSHANDAVAGEPTQYILGIIGERGLTDVLRSSHVFPESPVWLPLETLWNERLKD